jgi:SAM-dependent methyltransferase
MIVEFHQRLFLSLRNRGVGGTLKNTFRNSSPVPAAPAFERPHPFDLLHGTDTGGRISTASLSVVSLSAFYSTLYLGIPPSALIQALSALRIQYEDFAFVDLGCGKGRALLVAAQFPFKHLHGVEIAAELCEIARANVAKDPLWAARISIVNDDATKVIFPDGPLFLYLYNPFLAPVLRRALANLERQLQRSPRPTYLFYADNPRYERVMNSFAFLTEISTTAYGLSVEDAAANPLNRTEERFTLYSADCTR